MSVVSSGQCRPHSLSSDPPSLTLVNSKNQLQLPPRPPPAHKLRISLRMPVRMQRPCVTHNTMYHASSALHHSVSTPNQSFTAASMHSTRRLRHPLYLPHLFMPPCPHASCRRGGAHPIPASGGTSDSPLGTAPLHHLPHLGWHTHLPPTDVPGTSSPCRRPLIPPSPSHTFDWKIVVVVVVVGVLILCYNPHIHE